MANGNSANLPAPYNGVQQDVPQANIKPNFCYSLLNFNTTSEGINLRNGDSSFARIVSANLGATAIFGKYGDTALFALKYDTSTTENKIYNIETGTLVYTSAALGAASFATQFFNKNLFFFTPSAAYAPGVKYNGAVWTVILYTNPAGSLTGVSLTGGGCGYKNRNYIVQLNEAAYWYSEIDAVGGVLTKIDLSGVTEQATTLTAIAKITLSDQISTVELLVFCFANGEILFYSGSYPDSESWQIVGRAKIGNLVSFYDSVFPYQGDAIILSDSGIASLRDLFLKGSQNALNLSLNSRVQKTWKTIIKLARASLSLPAGPISASIQGIWDEVNSRIYILLPFTYTPYYDSTFLSSGNFFFVFDAIRSAWYFHRSGTEAAQLPISDLVYYKNKLLYTTQITGVIPVMQKEGSTGFMDRNIDNSLNTNYDFEYISAPIPFPKTAVYQTDLIEPIIQSDMYAETLYQLLADFGRQTSGNQLTDASTSAVAKPAVNVGISNGTFVQVRMYGNTVTGKTVGINLYSYNIWYDAGEKGSR